MYVQMLLGIFVIISCAGLFMGLAALTLESFMSKDPWTMALFTLVWLVVLATILDACNGT